MSLRLIKVRTVVKVLIDERFRVTQKNKIGYDNAVFMRRYEEKIFGIHDHADAMIFEVIEEERRIAHVSGKLTWFDLFDSEEVQAPDENVIEKYLRNPTESPHLRNYFDKVERFSRSVDENLEDFRNDKDLRLDILELDKKSKCWSCGDWDSELFVCNQCRRARYCDPLCQDEHWSKHSQWCREVRKQVEKEREGETKEEREVRKMEQKSVKTRMNEAVQKEIERRKQMATIFEDACVLARRDNICLFVC